MSSAKWRPFCLGLSVLNSSITNHKASKEGAMEDYVAFTTSIYFINY